MLAKRSWVFNKKWPIVQISRQAAVPIAAARGVTEFAGRWQEPTDSDRARHDPEQVFRAGTRHHHLANTAYPIAHTKTFKPYKVKRARDMEAVDATVKHAFAGLDEMMLYVHVPFCHTRCQFCEYTVVDPKIGRQQDWQSHYFDAMLKEGRMYSELIGSGAKKLGGMDIGGGTPSMASIADIERVMDMAHKHYNLTDDVEISIETTPKIAAAEPDKIRAYRKMGIRRISMGVQTTDFRQAASFGRDDANASDDYLRKSVENIREAGFDSFNIDLMYGFPLPRARANRKTPRDPWAKTVLDVIGLNPDHITLYRMRYKGTSMAHLQDRVGLDQVNAQEDVARNILAEFGFEGYVGKNTYSRNHHSGCSDYLDKRVTHGLPYVGLGLGAQSFSYNTLSYNLGAVTKKMQQYLKSVDLGRLPIQDLYWMSREQALGKFVSVSFYFGGIHLESFRNFAEGLSVEQVFPEQVHFAVAEGLMAYTSDDGGRLQLTRLGKKHFGGVISLFYAPSVQDHLVTLPGGEDFGLDIMDRARNQRVELEAKALDEQVLEARMAAAKRPEPAAPATTPYSATPLASARASGLLKPRGGLVLPTGPTVAQAHGFSSAAAPAAAAQEPFEFGNILFGGPCNQKCYFCIGQDLPANLTTDNRKQWPLANIDRFVERMLETGTRRIILTGSSTDPQLYKHEKALLAHLRERLPGCHISLHTNGLNAMRKLDEFNSYDTATISINSFEPETFRKIHGVRSMPDLEGLLKNSDVPIKLSCVLTPENKHEAESYVERCADLGVKRVAMRHIFHEDADAAGERWSPFPGLEPASYHCGNPVYDVNGVEVTHWRFEQVNGRSLNLFADGTLSEQYLLTDAKK